LECLCKKGSYDKHPMTTLEYKPRAGEDPDTLEWRITNPDDVQVKALHLLKGINAWQ